MRRVPVDEAARLLGCKPVTVKLRLLRGTLRGGKTWTKSKGLCWTWVNGDDLRRDLLARGTTLFQRRQRSAARATAPVGSTCPTCGQRVVQRSP